MSFPYIFTFYSFKGGVGRSMAAANVAYALASRGRNVLLMDMDLEAPGLSTFFHKSKEVEEKSPLDVLDLLGWADGWVKTHPGEYPDLDAIAKEGPNIGGFFLPVPREKVPKPRLGEAGRLDLILVDTDRNYLQRFGDLHLPELPRDRIVRMSRVLWAYFKSRRFPREVPEYYGLAAQPQDTYDYVIVDSRTGLTEIGALCIGPLADRLVVFTGLNVQNVEGTADFLKTVGVTKPREESDKPHDEADALPSDPNAPPRLGPKPTLLVASPVPIGETALKQRRMKALQRKLQLPLASALTYHPLVAVRETLFVRDLPGEYLAMEYSALADRVMAMVGDHAAQLARASTKAWSRGQKVTAMEAVVRLAAHDPSLGESLLQQLVDLVRPASREDFIATDRMCRILASEGAAVPWLALLRWGALLSDWASRTDDAHTSGVLLDQSIARLDAVIGMQGTPAEEKVKARLSRSFAYGGKGQRDREIADYTAAIDEPAATTEQRLAALIGRGTACLLVGDPERAIADFTAVINDKGATSVLRALALSGRAQAYQQGGDTESAISDSTRLIEDPTTPAEQMCGARLSRGLAYQAKRETDRAIADYTAVIDDPHAPPDYLPRARMTRAAAFLGKGETDRALTDLSGVICDPATPAELKAKALLDRGLAKHRNGDTQGAIADFSVVLDMTDAPTGAKTQALVNRGVARGDAGNIQGAIADYSAVLEMESVPAEGKARALLNRSTAQGEAGDTERAMADANAVIDMQDAPAEQRAKAAGNLGWMRYMAGDLDGAVTSAKQALALMPGLGLVHANLGLALLRLGRTDEGLRQYETAICLIGDTAQLDKDVVAEIRDAMKAEPGLPGAEAVLEMVERRKRELAGGSGHKPESP